MAICASRLAAKQRLTGSRVTFHRCQFVERGKRRLVFLLGKRQVLSRLVADLLVGRSGEPVLRRAGGCPPRVSSIWRGDQRFFAGLMAGESGDRMPATSKARFSSLARSLSIRIARPFPSSPSVRVTVCRVRFRFAEEDGPQPLRTILRLAEHGYRFDFQRVIAVAQHHSHHFSVSPSGRKRFNILR